MTVACGGEGFVLGSKHIEKLILECFFVGCQPDHARDRLGC